MTSSVTCSIIPPYVLEALAASGDPHLERFAERTLRVDERLRRDRNSPTAGPSRELPTPPEPSAAGGPGQPHRTIFDAERGTRLPGRQARTEGEPDTGEVAVDEAYAGLGETYALWRDAYGRDSLDGKGLPLLATVHYGEDYENAFWDGDQMVFGDGDGLIFGRFTKSLDVIGHELAHGVTQYTSGLVYRGQPGALNEHISDVFGVLVVQHSLRQRADEADWLVGADLLMPGVQGVALRSMIAPGTAYDDPRLGRDPQPAHMDDFVVTTADHGGVHINSGIPNRAFVLAAIEIGGYAWERAGQIWCDAITGDIGADCDFETFASLTVAAAERRYGAGSPEQAAVANGWTGVGVRVESGGPGPVSTESPSEPGGEPGANAEVRVRRSGGFAGMVRESTVRLEDLDEVEAREWDRLLRSRELQAAAAAAHAEAERGADRFWYEVCCDEPPVDVEVPEQALRPATRELLDRTLEQPPQV